MLHLAKLLHLVNLLQPFNLLIIAKCFVLNIHEHQLKEYLVHLLLCSCVVYFSYII
jgi:hypothetical protein